MSSTSSDVSQASTKVSGDDNGQGKTASRHQPPQLLQRIAQRSATSSQDVLLFLIAFRLLNALAVRTFFQPDEYFQSLEPAWEYAFGSDSGAWITWVGRLRVLHTLFRHATGTSGFSPASHGFRFEYPDRLDS